MSEIFLWVQMLLKRFFHRPLYFVFLLLSLLCVPFLHQILQGDSSMLAIGVVCEGEHEYAKQIQTELLEMNTIVSYQSIETEEEAMEALRCGSIDCVYLLPDDLTERIERRAEGKKDALVTVYVRKEGVQTALVREQFYQPLYPALSRALTRAWLEEEGLFDGEEEMEAIYDSVRGPDFPVIFVSPDGTGISEDSNYLTAPLRGIAAVTLLLFSLALALFYKEDDKAGRFSWMRIRHRRAFPLLYVMTGLLPGIPVLLAAVALTGTFSGIGGECVCALGYAFMCAGFACLVERLMPTTEAIGTAIPILVILTLVLCPIFLRIKLLPMVRQLLPTLYYIEGIHDPVHRMQMAIYIPVVWGLVLLIPRRNARL